MADRLFRDRREAGRVLARLLEHYRRRDDVLVLGLPRGGVPVAYDEVAAAVGAALDVFGVLMLNDDAVRAADVRPEVIERVAEEEGRELVRREHAYRDGRPMAEVAGKTVIVVDDGLATGASMRATIRVAPAGPRVAGGRRSGQSAGDLPTRRLKETRKHRVRR